MTRRYEFPTECKLLGGFHCLVTMAERNLWYEHLTQTPIFQRASQISDEQHYLMCAIKGGDLTPETKANFESLAAEMDVVNASLYELGKAWFAELTKDEKRESVEV